MTDELPHHPDNNTPVPNDIICRAYIKFSRAYHDGRLDTGLQFWRFLGMEYTPDTDPASDDWYMPEKAAHYCRLLAGPYFCVIARMLINKGHTTGKNALHR
jgi:hypothetical protein